MRDNDPSGYRRVGQFSVIVAFSIVLTTDLLTDILWFFKFGFKASKLGSIFVSGLLFHYAYQGSSIARWLTVGLLALALIYIVATGTTLLHPLMFVILLATIAPFILLLLPQVGVYQLYRRSGDQPNPIPPQA